MSSMSVDVTVHLYPATPILYTPFPTRVDGGPFVSVRLGGSGRDVSLIVTDPAALTALIGVATVARADLEAIITRAADPAADRAATGRVGQVA